jgi:LmbE family N-acetylglucosaminyl deacetylase
MTGGPVLVIAPHPDDEVLGVGGTMARLASEGREVVVAIVTRGEPPTFSESFVEQGRHEALAAHELLDVRKTLFLDGAPAAMVDTVPRARLNAVVDELFREVDPEIAFAPFIGDLHVDHRLIAEATLVAVRPNRTHRLRKVFAYEVQSETNWNATPLTPGFHPNTYVEITSWLEKKLDAMRCFESQLKEFPHERSLEALEALARIRGATAGCRAAEGFVLLRSIEPEDARFA